MEQKKALSLSRANDYNYYISSHILLTDAIF